MPCTVACVSRSCALLGLRSKVCVAGVLKAKTMEERRRRVVERAGARDSGLRIVDRGLLPHCLAAAVGLPTWASESSAARRQRQEWSKRTQGNAAMGDRCNGGMQQQGKYGAGGAATGKRSFGNVTWRDTRQVVCATDCARSDARGDARNCAGGAHLAAPMTGHEQGQGTFRMAAHTDSGGVWV